MRRLLLMTMTVFALGACGDSPTGPNGDALGGSLPDAVPLGTSATLSIRGSIVWGNGDVRVTVREVVRGDEAGAIVEAANPYNESAPDGFEYLLAKVRVEVLGLVDENEPISMSHVRWDAVRADGSVYNDDPIVSGVDPDLRTDLFAGADYEGWTYFWVAEGDSPYALFDRGDEWATWFRLTPD